MHLFLDHVGIGVAAVDDRHGDSFVPGVECPRDRPSDTGEE